MAYRATTIANKFLELAERDGKKLTNMKLQKLVYIAHGYYLVATGQPLISDSVKAWQWGPVIIDLYEALKRYGSGNVSNPVPAPAEQLSQLAIAVIELVWKAYGKFTGFQLSAITHKPNSPWSETWENWGHYDTISNDLIAQYYRTLLYERRQPVQPT